MNLDQHVMGWRLHVLVFAALLTASTAAAGERVNKDASNLAIRGYDTVAYFTDGRSIKGKPEFQYVWQDARWLFASAEHKTLFADDPVRYAPQFGGFCTGGVSLGRLSPIDPEAWLIVEGRLYLYYDKQGRDESLAELEADIAAATEKWEALRNVP
ncbi:YHS domain-containing (seleno)protein [Geminicoccus roseus]|uniref:YHS domain-containing (seleno)protein n=1 Tax=Geminicoccus roseus TaxID=404900 RepID=UPI000403AA42|nr:YHS domain-containing (seleno)protein [Geminicoccus roseus]